MVEDVEGNEGRALSDPFNVRIYQDQLIWLKNRNIHVPRLLRELIDQEIESRQKEVDTNATPDYRKHL